MHNISETSYSQPITLGGLLVMLILAQSMASWTYVSEVRKGPPHYYILDWKISTGDATPAQPVVTNAPEHVFKHSWPIVDTAGGKAIERSHQFKLWISLGSTILATVGIIVLMRYFGFYWPISLTAAAVIPLLDLAKALMLQYIL